jgi:hypothetical protein
LGWGGFVLILIRLVLIRLDVDFEEVDACVRDILLAIDAENVLVVV